MRKKILIIVLLILAVAIMYGVKEFYRTRDDSKMITAKFKVTSIDILKEFETDEVAASNKYKGQDLVIAVTGAIKEVKLDEKGYATILLGEENAMSSVVCAMDTLYTKDVSNLKAPTVVTIKGKFNGYNKDETGLLGSDIQMNMCVLDQQ